MAGKSAFTSPLAGLSSIDPKNVQFLMFDDDEMRKLSVVKIVSPTSFDIMGNATPGGLYDIAMGPNKEKNELCGTCSNMMIFCPGHFGHIDLPVTVVNPIFLKNIYTLFRISCLKCFKIQMNDKMKFILKLQLNLIDAGHVTAALDLENFGEIYSDGSEKPVKSIRKYQKLLKTRDGVIETFQNKNTDVLRKRILNNYFKIMSVTKSCMYCTARIVKITTSDNKLMHSQAGTDGTRGIKILMPDEIQDYCTKITENDEDILIHFMPILKSCKKNPVSNFMFMEMVPVPPPNIRPCNFLRGELMEHPQTNIYKQILNNCLAIRTILHVMSSKDVDKAVGSLEQKPRLAYESAFGKTATEKMHNSWQELQKSVNQILNCEGTAVGTSSRGIKQVLERKTGVIRMHMMGKRVNFAARSVITPDPNVAIDEIGVPDVFAKKLTYPVPVTEWNVEELRKMVINGPNKHPGAEKLEIENGRMILIPADSIQKRRSLAKRLLTPDEYKSSGLKKVHRHLLNGDVLILNRQPSLHKPSMMAHRARILKGEKTLRLHYANCKSYNADFDGDEMNAHFVQNEIARSEAYNIMSVRKQYLVPKDGTPLSGLIQDHVISGVKMSLRGTFFTKSDYHQLVFQALPNHKGEIKLLPPAIMKPMVLWSGKQVLSTIIINNIPKGKPLLSLASKAKISAKAWQVTSPRAWAAGGTPFADTNTMTEAEVIIRKGELLSGVLDKTHYGATPYGLVHCMFELYGGDSSSAFLSSLSKVFTYYLQWAGFTLGVRDILVVEEADKKRDDFIYLVRQSGKIAAAKATDLPLDVDDQTMKDTIGDLMIKDPKFRATLDRQYKSVLDEYTNKINKACLSEGLLEKFPDNNLQLMVQSGAKGSTVNTMQISCLLGQIELEGKRPPLMISGKSLPSFPPYDTSPRAGGFIDGRFMTGIQPQEFFFHCMAGREGLIDTAVKTSRSGYLQRCLIKHLEGLSVGYDHTVRDSDSSVIQFAYGEDGLDVLKCQYLKQSQFDFLDVNSDAVISETVIEKLKEESDLHAIAKAQKSLKKWKKKFGDPQAKHRGNAFTEFCRLTKDEIDEDDLNKESARDPCYAELERRWRALDDEDRKQYGRKTCPEPLQSTASPNFKLGVINEQLDNLIQNYLKKRSESPYDIYTEKEKFIEVMNAKYLASMADPGEPVGLLAAQSIGEPSTQMTLNTFHFAGRGDMNVTLGIPRLREILMTASANLKTPNMDIPFHDIPDVKKKAEKLRLKLNRVSVSDVLEKIDVGCEIVMHPERRLKVTTRFAFLPHNQYKSRFTVKPAQIIKHMETKFFPVMFATVRKHVKANPGIVWTREKESKKPRKANNDDDEDPEPIQKEADLGDLSSDEEAPNDDDDNTDAKIRQRRTEDQEYEDPETDEEEKSDDEGFQDQEPSEEPVKDKEVEETQTEENISARDSKAIATVLATYSDAKNYTFDTKKHRWCELTTLFPISFLRIDLSQVLREAAAKSVIHEVKNIKRAIVDDDKGLITLRTEGINIVQMAKYEHLLNMNKLYSNDIHAIANTYGIEAATRVLIKEIQNVFNVYGITVDPRHLSLVSDYMTYNGRYEPMSRRGMEASSSPLQQMSFESSLVFLKEAVLNSKFDHLQSSSSCLMVGQPCKSGTGAFSLQHYNNDTV